MSRSFTALIVEPRKHKALPFVLRNFLDNLDNRWNFLICHGTENIDWITELINNDFSEDKYRITLKNLNVSNVSKYDYSILLTNYDFINSIATEVFLVFQTDTLICSPYKDLINQFLDYDYVGAPWSDCVYLGSMPCRGVGNGGLSLRKKSKMLEIISKFPYKNGWPEDMYFSGIIGDFPSSITLYKPSVEDAKKFSIETIYSPQSFGIHNPWPYIADITEMQCPGITELKHLQN